MKCPACGKRLKRKQSYCTNCGSPINVEDSLGKPKKKHRVLRAIGITFGGFFALIVLMCILFPPTDVETNTGGEQSELATSVSQEAQETQTTSLPVKETQPASVKKAETVSNSAKRKIDRYFKKSNYDKLCNMYAKLNGAEKAYFAYEVYKVYAFLYV